MAICPIDIVTVKKHLGEFPDVVDEDALIATWMDSATERCERITGHTISAARTRFLYFDRFPSRIELPYPPVISVTSIKYRDTGGVERTLDPSLYQVDILSFVPRVVPAYGTDWPDTREVPNAVTIEYIAGYSTAAAAVAALPSYVSWILIQICKANENRDGSLPLDDGPLGLLVDRIVY
jgi:uncharacterized phiE125 gp8 family phage protein